MVLKPQIKRIIRRIRGYWHNRQLIKTKRVKAEDWVTEGHANGNKIILMAIDALTWRIVDPLLDQGRLPHLQSLIERGSYGPLKTLCPALSPELWNTISTGKLPRKHGITGFMARDPETRRLVPYTSNMRRCKAIWEILGDHNKRVGVVGWWNTWPAEPVNGSMISDILGYKIKDMEKVKDKDRFVELTRKSRLNVSSFNQQTYPESLFDEISQLIRPLTQFEDAHGFIRRIWEMGDGLGQPEKDSLKLMTSVYNIDRTYGDVAKYIYRESRPDILTFYIAGIDVVGHKYWAYMEPERFPDSLSPRKIALYAGLIHDYYAYVDEIIGEFLEMADDDTTLAVVSDHGMSPAVRIFRKTRINSARHFDEDGVFLLMGPHIRADNRVGGTASVLDITPTLLRLMGLPIGADMDGCPIEDVFTPAFRSENPLRFIRTYDTDRTFTNRPIESPVDEAIKERLKSLGYID